MYRKWGAVTNRPQDNLWYTNSILESETNDGIQQVYWMQNPFVLQNVYYQKKISEKRIFQNYYQKGKNIRKENISRN